MPMGHVDVSNTTVAISSFFSALIAFVFLLVVGYLKPAISFVLAVIIGALLYYFGIIPIGLLVVVGIAMVVAIFKTLTGKSAGPE